MDCKLSPVLPAVRFMGNSASRSLALNEEVGVGIRDEAVAQQLKTAFEADLFRSKRRPWRSHVFDWMAYRLHSQL